MTLEPCKTARIPEGNDILASDSIPYCLGRVPGGLVESQEKNFFLNFQWIKNSFTGPWEFLLLLLITKAINR